MITEEEKIIEEGFNTPITKVIRDIKVIREALRAYFKHLCNHSTL